MTPFARRAQAAHESAENASASSRTTGMTLPNISAAMRAPSVSTSSSSRKTSAAGARPFNAMSSSTPEPEQEPRLVGISSTAPASETPRRG